MSTPVRNIAIVGHAGSGKTTLTEGLAFAAGATTRRGSIKEGTTLSDYHPDEISRRHSINTSLVSFHHGDTKLNLLDAPGYSDFSGEVRSALHVADTAVLVVNGQLGLEIGTDQAWDFCTRDENSVVFVVNKVEAMQDYDAIVQELKDHFGHETAIVQFPYRGAAAIVDVLRMKLIKTKPDGTCQEEAIPDDVREKADRLHRELVEIVAESDDTLMEEFFANDGQLDESHFAGGIHESLAHRKLFPILCVNADANLGVRRLLDFLVNNAPAPEDHLADVTGENPQTKQSVSLSSAPKDATTLFVFKTVSESHLGELSYFRVFHGELHSGVDLINESNGKSERVGQIFTMFGKNRKEQPRVPSGDIAAAVKLRDTHTNNTLSSRSFPVVLRPIEFPEPVITNGVRAKNKGDEEKLAVGLHGLHEEDPTFVVEHDGELHQTLIHGQGELHLDIILRRLTDKAKIEAEIVEPKIPFRETIRSNSDTRYRHRKQSGGAGQFGEVAIRVAPKNRGEGYEFLNAVVGGVISGKHVPAVDKGIHEFLTNGPLAGYPVVDVSVTLYDGKEHPVDSNENAFRTAGKMAFKEAFLNAKPVLLEPIYEIEVTVPDEHMGDVLGDISSRRGKVLGMDSKGSFEVIRANVPLAELHHYATRLRSLTQGRGSHRQKFGHYEEAPHDIALKVAKESDRHLVDFD